jgi:leucine dehydrogenase
VKIESIPIDGVFNVHKFTDEGFTAFISLYNVNLGPGIGGCRVSRYDHDADALRDVLYLSKAMSFKNSLAGIKYGGAKMVVNADKVDEALLEKIGHAINHLNGNYISGTDLGTSLDDMHVLAKYTKWVEKGRFGDTAIYTALGIYSCISMMELKCPTDNVNIWVQGVGNVGMELVKLLCGDSWFNIYVSDLDPVKVAMAKREYGAQDYKPNVPIHIYAPCAMGPVITLDNLHKFRNMVICGGANNQLAGNKIAKLLYKQNVLYCPDYLVNAGGVIAIAAELENWSESELREYIEDRANLLYALVDLSDHMDIDLLTLTDFISEQRMLGD